MGGNALKNCKTKRLNKELYLKYEQELINLIQPLVTFFYIPRYFNEKETFGDIDIVYYINNSNEFLNLIKNLFNSKDVFYNGDITSFEYNEFQVDLIKSRPYYFNNHCCFLDFNDFGGILGQMISRYELKYGFEGFYYKVHRDHIREHYIDEIHLSSDPQEIFNYLGLDYNHFVRGFETPNEMFQFLSTCIYCSTKSYSTENINTVHRKRLKHRPVYQKFIEFISTTTPPIPDLPSHPALVSLPIHKQHILDYFHCEETYHQIIRLDDESKLIKSKFNGGLVMNLTGLEGKELGTFIVFFKKHLSDLNTIGNDDSDNNNNTNNTNNNNNKSEGVDEKFNQYILQTTEESIQQLINDVYQIYNTSKSDLVIEELI